MRDEDTTAIIHEQAESIMNKIKSCNLFGQQIDLLNPDEILLAAYGLGQYETRYDWEALGNIA